jgi:hypothetical protein
MTWSIERTGRFIPRPTDFSNVKPSPSAITPPQTYICYLDRRELHLKQGAISQQRHLYFDVPGSSAILQCCPFEHAPAKKQRPENYRSGMSALGQERPFRPGPPNVCFAPIADIRRYAAATADVKCGGLLNCRPRRLKERIESFFDDCVALARCLLHALTIENLHRATTIADKTGCLHGLRRKCHRLTIGP